MRLMMACASLSNKNKLLSVLSDAEHLVDAMAYHMKQLEEERSAGAKQSFVAEQVRRHQETPQVGRLLSLYVDDSVADPTPFGEVRQRAYKIMSKDTLQSTAQRMSVKPLNKLGA